VDNLKGEMKSIYDQLLFLRVHIIVTQAFISIIGSELVILVYLAIGIWYANLAARDFAYVCERQRVIPENVRAQFRRNLFSRYLRIFNTANQPEGADENV
jgi:hypothetical protein